MQDKKDAQVHLQVCLATAVPFQEQGLCNLDGICATRKPLFQYVSHTLASLQHPLCMSISPAFSLLFRPLGCVVLSTWLLSIYFLLLPLRASFYRSEERSASAAEPVQIHLGRGYITDAGSKSALFVLARLPKTLVPQNRCCLMSLLPALPFFRK